MWNLLDGPPRGLLHLGATIGLSALMFVTSPGRGGRGPSVLEQFQSGNPSDFAVVYTLGILIWIGYAVAVVIADYRSTGRLW